MRTSCRVRDFKPFIVMDVLERAQEMERQGESVIHLEIGEPDFDTPEPIKRAAEQAIRDGHTHYTHSQGLPELREAICAHYQERYAVRVHPDQVIVSSGTSPAMMALFSSILEAGDEVILTDPHYACYPNFIRFAGGVPVCVPVAEEDGFQYRPSEVARRLTPRTRAVLVNSPSNPTGTVLSDERMRALADLVETTDAVLVSDEIYHGLVYEGRERSVLEFTDRAFVFNGFSKLHAMTGWRLGYLISPPACVPVIRRLFQNFFISAGSVSQWAGLAALTQAGPDIERMRSAYAERRRFLVGRLREIGFGVDSEPTGAFYVLANAKRFSNDSLRLAFDILERAKVAVTPGVDFGAGGEGYIRFSYANSVENISIGMERIERYLAERRATIEVAETPAAP